MAKDWAWAICRYPWSRYWLSFTVGPSSSGPEMISLFESKYVYCSQLNAVSCVRKTSVSRILPVSGWLSAAGTSMYWATGVASPGVIT